MAKFKARKKEMKGNFMSKSYEVKRKESASNIVSALEKRGIYSI